MGKISREFFNRDTVLIAKDLLGKYLFRRIDRKIIRVRITETEAYCGQHDLACHASKGLTERTKVMFGPPGHAYIYLIYGMYHCFNVVTREVGCPEAVLIRGAEIATNDWRLAIRKKREPLLASDYLLVAKLDGPGKLCRELKIDKNLNGIDICNSRELWIEDRGEKLFGKIREGKRVGVSYAGKWKDK